jgi:hypothetical protein
VTGSWYIQIFEILLLVGRRKYIDAPLERVPGPEIGAHFLINNFSIGAEDNWTSSDGSYCCHQGKN